MNSISIFYNIGQIPLPTLFLVPALRLFGRRGYEYLRRRMMTKFYFHEMSIKGLYIVEPAPFTDARGYFMESYNRREFADAGLTAEFVQDNESRSARGVLRGMHFQSKYPQGKLVRVISGEVFDVAVDLRAGSATYGRWEGVYLSDKNKKMFYIPEGFAHGFLVISETAVFGYKCTDYYHPEDEGGFIYNDESVGIEWPDVGGVILSEKDAKLERLI